MAKKPKMLTAGTPPSPMLVSTKGIARATLRTALDKAPWIGILTKWHDSIEAVHREERLQLWLEHVRGEETGDDFRAKIEDGLKGPHAEYVRDAVLESTRAATDALDDAAIPAIARLTSKYLHSKTPDLWTYRDVLALLRSLDAEMLGAFRIALSKLDELMRAEIVRDSVSTEVDFDDVADDDSLVWRVPIQPTRDRTPNERAALSELGRGPAVRRLVAALAGSSAGLFSGTSRITPPHFTRELVDTLRPVL